MTRFDFNVVDALYMPKIQYNRATVDRLFHIELVTAF